jgi:uncharacterized membrane protein
MKSVKSLVMPSKCWLLLVFLPIGIDGVSQALGLYASPHWLRFLTGVLCGGTAMFYIIPGFNEVIKMINEKN